MSTVTKAAIGGILENLREIMRYLRVSHLDRTKSLDPRRINQVTTVRKRDHFREGRGMHTHIMIIGDLPRTQAGTRHQLIDNRRFAYTRMAGKQSDAILEVGPQGIESLFRLGTELRARITNRGIEMDQPVKIFPILVIVTIDLVENQLNRHPISLGSRQETIDKDGGRNRIVDRHDQQRLIKVGRQDMCLLGKI